MRASELFKGIFKIDGKLCTINLSKGKRVYGEELIQTGETEYRMWNPFRSKLAAAIMNGLKNMEIKKGNNVLYLGAATGTTSSHISDIVDKEGTVYCIEFSERSMRDLLKACESRENMLPILKDARLVEEYEDEVGEADILYQDVSAKDQADILLRNSKLLKHKGYAYVAIKSQSISLSKNPKQIFDEFLKEISQKFEVLEKINIEPYDSKHLFVVLVKK